jgi:F-type H+-transporting ATPase subunit b
MGALDKLGINWLLIVAQIVNFAILLFILHRFLYKPLLKLFHDRSSKIAEGLKNAEDLKKQAAESEAKHREYLEEARKEAHRIVEQATRLGDDEKKKIVQLANEEAQKIVDRTTREINDEKRNIMQDIKKEVGEMVVSLASTMIKKTIDEKTQKELLEDAIKEVEQELEKTGK